MAESRSTDVRTPFALCDGISNDLRNQLCLHRGAARSLPTPTARAGRRCHWTGAEPRWRSRNVEPMARPALVFGGAHFSRAALGVGRRKTPTHTVGKTSCGVNTKILGASEEARMKVREGLTKPSEPDKVDAYMNKLKH